MGAEDDWAAMEQTLDAERAAEAAALKAASVWPSNVDIGRVYELAGTINGYVQHFLVEIERRYPGAIQRMLAEAARLVANQTRHRDALLEQLIPPFNPFGSYLYTVRPDGIAKSPTHVKWEGPIHEADERNIQCVPRLAVLHTGLWQVSHYVPADLGAPDALCGARWDPSFGYRQDGSFFALPNLFLATPPENYAPQALRFLVRQAQISL